MKSAFTFFQISDVHVGSEANVPTHERLHAAVGLINALHPAFVIDTGDVATHPVYRADDPEYLAEFTTYLECLRELSTTTRLENMV